jgi:hypothetical protein
MQPIEAENPGGTKGSRRRSDRPSLPRLQILIPHPIPQITYSEPPDDPSQEQTDNQLSLALNSAAKSENSLSPPRSPNRPTSSPTSPLPLTRDILLKKDKLDRTWDRVEHRNRKQEDRQGSHLDIREWQKKAEYQQHSRNSSVNSASEPLSAGGSLTIPSPKDATHLSLRAPSSPQFFNFMHENVYKYPSGGNDSSVRNSSQSGSSGNINRWSSLMSTKSAQSGSSVADDNLSAEAFDPTTHYYAHREDYHRHLTAEGWFQARGDLHRPPYARPRLQSSSTASSYFGWKILTSVANRVVMSKSCETPATIAFIVQNKSFAASTDWLFLTGDDAYFAAQNSVVQTRSKLAKPVDASSINTNEKVSGLRHSRSSGDYSSTVNDRLTPVISLTNNSKSSGTQDYPNYNAFKYPEPLSPKISEKVDAVEIENITPVPKPTPLEGTSLFIFSSQNRFRLFLWNLLRSQYVDDVDGSAFMTVTVITNQTFHYSRYIEIFIFLLIFLQWILLASTPIYTNTDKTSFGGTNVHYVILGIQCVYRYVHFK